VAEDLPAESLLAGSNGTDSSKRERAAEWLIAQLKDGPVLRSKLIWAGRLKGFSFATLRRASDDIGVDSFQEQTAGKVGRGPAFWFLPAPPPDHD